MPVPIIDHETEEEVGTLNEDGTLDTSDAMLRDVAERMSEEGGIQVLTSGGDDDAMAYGDWTITPDDGGFMLAFIEYLPSPFTTDAETMRSLEQYTPPDEAYPSVDAESDAEGDGDDEKAVQYVRDAELREAASAALSDVTKEWSGPHEGPRGGTYWENTETGERRYDEPGSGDGGEDGDTSDSLSFDEIETGDTVQVQSPDGDVVTGEVDRPGDSIFVDVDGGGMMHFDDGLTTSNSRGEWSIVGMEGTGAEQWESSPVPDSADEAFSLYMDNYTAEDGEVDEEVQERWRRAFEAGVGDLDMEEAKPVIDGFERNQDNEKWQSFVQAAGIEEDVIAIDPSKANEAAGNRVLPERGGGKFVAGTAFIRVSPHILTANKPRDPEPGQSAASSNAGTTIRHELSHKIWEESDDDFREWFSSAVPDDDALRDGLTEYAANRDDEEAFNELVATYTHPEFDPDEFPGWVSELGEEALSRLDAQGDAAEKWAAAATDRLLGKSRYEKTDDALAGMHERLVQWDGDDLSKAPAAWPSDDEVPEYVKEYVEDAIDSGVGWDEFAGYSRQTADAIHDTFEEKLTQPQGWSVGSIVDDLQEKYSAMDDSQALNIVQTELSVIFNSAREQAYKDRDDGREYLFYWQGPSDHRTTDVCMEIKEEVDDRGGNVPMEELRSIVRSKAKKYAGTNQGGTPERADEWLPHFKCRHTMVRDVKATL